MAQGIGSRIVELRSAQGLSQEGLANQLGLSRQAVSRWERGEALPDTENLIALADLFGVTLDELVRPQASIEQDAGATQADAGELDETPEQPATAEVGGESVETEAKDTPDTSPEPTATVPPPRPLWMKALLLVAAAACLAVSFLFLSSVADYVTGAFSSSTGEQYAAPPIAIDGSQVRSIEVIWSASEVGVIPAEDGQSEGNVLIQTYGPEPSPEDMGVTWELADGRLRITCMPDDNSGETTVQITVPMDVALNLQELSLEASDGASGFVSSMRCEKIHVHESDGFAQLDGCEASELDVRATAGTVWFAGTYRRVEIDAKDGAGVTFGAEGAQEMTGALDARLEESSLSLSIPEGAGLTLTQKGEAYPLDTNLPLVYGEDGAVYGSGEIKVSITADANSYVNIMGTEVE